MFRYVFDQIPLYERQEGHSKVFIAHSYHGPHSADIRRAVRRAMEPDLSPYYADEGLGTEFLLVRLARRIMVSRLFLCDLSDIRDNLMIELGLALGMNKMIILTCKTDSRVPSFLDGLGILRYESYGQLSDILEEQKHQARARAISKPTGGWCQLCQQHCQGRISSESHSVGLVVDSVPSAGHHSDFVKAVKAGFEPEITVPFEDLRRSDMRHLCSLIHAIRSARFAVFRLASGMSPVVPLMFGISYGMRVPSIIAAHKNTNVPSDLRGYMRLEYTSFNGLEEDISQVVPSFLDDLKLNKKFDHWTNQYGNKVGEALANVLALTAQPQADLDEILDSALMLGLYAIGSWAGSLMLVSEGNRLEIASMVAPEIEMKGVGEWRMFEIGEGICGQVAETANPYFTGNVTNDPVFVGRTYDVHSRSLACVPIVYERKVLGVINADSRDIDRFEQTDINVLSIVADILAPTIYSMNSAAEDGMSTISTRTHDRLVTNPSCLACGEPTVFIRFQRKSDSEGLRYKMWSECNSCGDSEMIRSYYLYVS